MKKQRLLIGFVVATVLFFNLPGMVLAYVADLPLVYGAAWEYGSDGLWYSRQLSTGELNIISDGNSNSFMAMLSSSIHRNPGTSAEIYAPFVVVAFDASQLTDRLEDLSLKASAYTINLIERPNQPGWNYGNNALVYKFAADDWRGLDPNNSTYLNWLGPYASWDTAKSQDSPTIILDWFDRLQGRDISPENLIWLKITSGVTTGGGYPDDSVATFQLTLNEISLSGDLTAVPIPGGLLLLGGLFRLVPYLRKRHLGV